MIEELIEHFLPYIIGIIEILGVIILVVGVIKSFWLWLTEEIKHAHLKVGKPLTKAMATSLEFLMAAEVLKTALLRDYKNIVIIACIIVLRAAFVFLLHYEATHERDLEDDEEDEAEAHK